MDRSVSESFLLDTCVASLILNGELWKRSPATLMQSRVDVYAAWRLANEDISATPQHNLELEKSIKAHRWALERCERGSPSLYLSPTVQEELAKTQQVYTIPLYSTKPPPCHRFLQFNYWCDPEELRMANLSRIEYIVSETDFFIVLKQLPEKLREVEPMVPREGRHIEFFTSALMAADTASSATNYKAHYHADLRLYMEAWLISNRMKVDTTSPSTAAGRRPRLLVTEDYKIFKGFVRSTYAHDVLRDLVISVLKLHDGVTVLLAGEVIAGV